MSSARRNVEQRGFVSSRDFGLKPNPSRRFSDIHYQTRQPPSEEFHNSRLSFELLSESNISKTHSSHKYLNATHGIGRKDLNTESLSALWPSGDYESDPEPSIHDVSAFDFPEPPPIGTPVIRRMRSSPWFLHDNVWDKDTVVHHWRSSIPMEPTTLSKRVPEKGDLRSGISLAHGSRNENAYWKEHTDLDHSSPGIGYLDLEPFGDDLPFDINDGWVSSEMCPDSFSRNMASASGNTRRPTSPARPVFESVKNNRKLIEEVKQEPAVRPLSSLPRIIRKVASMRSDSPKGNPENHISMSHGKTLPKSRSFRSILRAHETDQTLRGVAKIKEQSMWMPSVMSYTDGMVTRASTNFIDSGMPFNSTNNQSSRQHTNSSPRNRLGRRSSGYYARDISVRDVLEEPFSQKNEQRRPMPFTSTERPNDAKSFINITPKQGIKLKVGAQRERVKNLVSRASNSWLGWGRWKLKNATEGNQSHT